MEEDKANLEVKPEEIRGLLEYFSKNTYKARDTHPKVGICLSYGVTHWLCHKYVHYFLDSRFSKLCKDV